ncbi:type II toxin-antitoxin system VapB family antitoxin [Oceanibaculum pacificum]|uniref:Transcription regulator of the Arc/MetJ class n=1 Tax=Oceanibaculum pacificum TaxID=580166 RepID=A0A154VA33_9PROT|nr:type II toxin-antitoxin system VapB family antitoxin [Oceanibaculum pacificum]KZC98240.1 hypothetical protein AUP43_14910 [Oceanibaculum pacificum]
MRTNIEIDDGLMAEAMQAAGLPTKRAVVEEGLRLLIQRRKQRDLLKLFGALPWDGDLEQSRQGRSAG